MISITSSTDFRPIDYRNRNAANNRSTETGHNFGRCIALARWWTSESRQASWANCCARASGASSNQITAFTTYLNPDIHKANVTITKWGGKSPECRGVAGIARVCTIVKARLTRVMASIADGESNIFNSPTCTSWARRDAVVQSRIVIFKKKSTCTWLLHEKVIW